MYSVYLENELIGNTLLEFSDPSMGIIHGEFKSKGNYGHFKQFFLSETRKQDMIYPLLIKTSAGEQLPTSHIGIIDYSDLTECDTDITIEIMMQSSEEFQIYFPQYYDQ